MLTPLKVTDSGTVSSRPAAPTPARAVQAAGRGRLTGPIRTRGANFHHPPAHRNR